MRSVNLISNHIVDLADWGRHLTGYFPSVRVKCSEMLAKREGQVEGSINEIMIDEDREHVDVSDRPTTINEYETEEIESLKRFIGHPTQFLAVDYTDERLLRRVLAALLAHEGKMKIVVEDENSKLAFLEDFLV